MEKEKETYSKDYQFKLRIIDETSDTLYILLGITEERAEELQNICKDSFQKYECKTDIYLEVFDKCVHINEVTFCFEVLQHIKELYNQNMKIKALMEGLSNMFEDGEE